jgi:hypothetical protein
MSIKYQLIIYFINMNLLKNDTFDNIIIKINDIHMNIELLNDIDKIKMQKTIHDELEIIDDILNKINTKLSNYSPDNTKYNNFVQEETKQRSIINKLYPMFYYLNNIEEYPVSELVHVQNEH